MVKFTRWPHDPAAQMIYLRKEHNYSILKIAQTMKISKRTLYAFLRRTGTVLPKQDTSWRRTPRIIWDADMINIAAELEMEGASERKIGRRLGVSASTYHEWRKTHDPHTLRTDSNGRGPQSKALELSGAIQDQGGSYQS